MLKDYDTNAKSNGHWINVLNMYKAFNLDTQNGYKEAVNKVSAADVSKFVKETLVNSNNCLEVTMNPEVEAQEPAKAQPAKKATAKKAATKKAGKKAKGKRK